MAAVTRRLVLSQTDSGRVRVELWDGDEVVATCTRSFDSDRIVRRAARRLGIATTDLRQAISAFERDGTCEHAISSTSSSLLIEVRGLRSSDSVATVEAVDPIESFEQILSTKYDVPEPLVVWDNINVLAAVDVDADGWDEGRLQSILEELQPRPCFAWTTHGGGLRFIYVMQRGITAEAVAALATVNLSTAIKYRNIEIKCSTRHPLGLRGEARCGVVRRLQQECDRRAVASWNDWVEPNDVAVAEYLAERGYVAGGRYPHDRCPVQPSDTATGTPVLVGQRGIKCFVCEAHGVDGGFFSWARLLGRSQSPTHLGMMLKNMTHWTHAQHVLRHKFDVPVRTTQLAYAVALKVVHPEVDDAMVALVFLGGRNLLRLDRRWATAAGETYVGELASVLAEVPVARDSDGQVNKSALVQLKQPHDLVNLGYPSLRAIYGCRIGCHFNRLEAYDVVFQVGSLRDDAKAQLRPRYVPPEERMRLEDAYALIEMSCPCINWSFVRLLIAAKGFAERGNGMPPMIFVTGPTGAAKTSTIKLVAAACGDVNSDVIVTDMGRTRQAVLEGIDRGSFVTFNEVTKVQSPREAMDLLLNFTPDSLVHRLYVGPVPLGRLPVFCWTDTHIPQEIRRDAQLSRRLVEVALPARVDWAGPLERSIGNVANVRTHSQLHADACNSIISDVADACFKDPTTFIHVAESLGHLPLERSEDHEVGEEVLRELFLAFCASPEVTGSDLTRLKSGWRRIERGTSGVLADLWEQVRDPVDQHSSRRCSEVDWRKIMGAVEPILFEVRGSGPNVLFIRFRSAETRRNHRFGMELLGIKS